MTKNVTDELKFGA